MDSYDKVAKKRAVVSCCCWEELPNGPLLEIAQRLSNFEDFMVLHLVCSRWNSILHSFRCKFLDGHPVANCAPQVPWLMMAEQQAVQIDEQLMVEQQAVQIDEQMMVEQQAVQIDEQHTLSLRPCSSKRKAALRLFFYTLSFQRVHGLLIRFPPQHLLDNFNNRSLHSSHGWLLVTSKGVGCCTMYLYNPFCSSTHNYIQLPQSDTFPQRFALSASPCTISYAVMITRHDGNVAFWRPGDDGWTVVGPRYILSLLDVTFYRGHYYALNQRGCLCNIHKRKNHTGEEYWFWNTLCGLVPRSADIKFIWRAYFVVVEEKLLVAVRVGVYPKIQPVIPLDYDYLTAAFQVMEIVFSPTQEIPLVKEVKSLGNKSLFVGGNQAFAIEVPQEGVNHSDFEASRYYGCKPNCIYFTDDRYCQKNAHFPAQYGRGTDMGVYNMADGSLERDFQGLSLDSFSPLLWVEPRC